MSVSSSDSVNSAIMYNMQIVIKMSFVIAVILRAIMIIVIIFKCPYKFKNQSLSRTHKFQKRTAKMFTICRM